MLPINAVYFKAIVSDASNAAGVVGDEATAVSASDAARSARRGRARRWLCGLTLAILGVAVGGDALAQQAPILTGAEIRQGGAVISSGSISGTDNLTVGDLTIDENDQVTLRLTYDRDIDSAVSISNYTPFGVFGSDNLGIVVNSEWTARPSGRHADIAFRVTRFFGTITVEVPMNFGGGTIATATVSVTVNDVNDPVSLYTTDSSGRFPVLPYVLEDGPLVTTRSFPVSGRQAFLFIVEPSQQPIAAGDEETHPITISLVDNSAIAEARLVHCTDADFGVIGGFVLGNCASGFDPDFANSGGSALTLDSPARRNIITVAVRPAADVAGPVTVQMAIKDDDLAEVTFSLPFAVYAAEDTPTVLTSQGRLDIATPTPVPVLAAPHDWRTLRSLRSITIHDADIEVRFAAAARNSTRVLAGLSDVDSLANDASVSISLILEDFPSGDRTGVRNGVSLRLATTEFGSLTATFNAGSGAQAGTWTIEFNDDNRISRGLTELSQLFRAIEYRDTFATSTPVTRRFEITYFDGADTSLDPRAVPYSNGLSFVPVPTPAPQSVAFTAAAGFMVMATDADGIPRELEEMINGLDPDETNTPEEIRAAVTRHCGGGYYSDLDNDGVPNNVEAALGIDCRDARDFRAGSPPPNLPSLSFGAPECAGDSGAYCAPGAGVTTPFDPQATCVGADGATCADVRPFFATESCLRNGGDAFGGEITDDAGEVVDPAVDLGVLAIGNPPGCMSAGSETQLNLSVGETRIAWFAVDALGNWVVADGGAVIQVVRVGALLEFNGETEVDADEATVVMVSVTTHGAPLPTPLPRLVITSGSQLPASLPRVGALAAVANNMENVWSYEAEVPVNLPPNAVFTLALPEGIFETSRTPNYYTEEQANQGWTITAMSNLAPIAGITLSPTMDSLANSRPPGILASDVVAGETEYELVMSANVRDGEMLSASMRLALLVEAPQMTTPRTIAVQTIVVFDTTPRSVAGLGDVFFVRPDAVPGGNMAPYRPVSSDLQAGDSAGSVSVRVFMPNLPESSTPLRLIADFAVVSRTAGGDTITTRALRAHYPIVPAMIGGETFDDFLDLIDADGDGVPNNIDTRNGIAEGNPQVLHAAEGELPLRTENEPSLTLRLGQYAAHYFAARVPDDVVGTPPGYVDGSGVYDFRLDLPSAGAVGRVVIPLSSTLLSTAGYYKYRGAGLGWVPFVAGNGDGVFWAPQMGGGCPSPSSLAEWRANARAGDRCVLLVIRDGGANDDDDIANFVVVDPGAVGAARGGGGGGGGGGGLVSLPMLLTLLLFVSLAVRRRRRRQRRATLLRKQA